MPHRLSVYAAGKLVDQQWVTNEIQADVAGERQSALVEKLLADGTPWMVEAYDPERPNDVIRLGTDPTMMTSPQILDRHDIEEFISTWDSQGGDHNG